MDAARRSPGSCSGSSSTSSLIPCVNPKLADWWLSEDLEMQEAAALACSTCPALRNCREYVEQWPEGGGVWAGILPPRRGVRNSSRDRLSRGDQ
jgi:Transcription factor WhiB